MDPLNLNRNVYSDQTLFSKYTDTQVDFLNVEYFFNKVYLFLRNLSGGGRWIENNSGVDAVSGVSNNVGNGININFYADILNSFLYLLIVFFLTVLVYCTIRMFEIRKKEHEHLRHEIAEYAHHQKEREKKKQEGSGATGKIKNERWENVLKHLYSESSADWKLAIIDADEMLFTLRGDLGFKGESLGDKLKSADRDDFHSLSAAWEVHTIRNRIAHEGLGYELSQREAKRVIALYEQIFHEFGYV